MFGKIEHSDLDRKIGRLESKVLAGQGFFASSSFDWDDIHSLIEEIFTDFKTVRYPKREERDEAWQRFYDLKNDAYETRNKVREDMSDRRYSEIRPYLRDADFDNMTDEFFDMVTFDSMKTNKEQMIWKGKQLKEAGQLLSQHKGEMLAKHKTEIFEEISRIREEHNIWWDKYKDALDERQKKWEQKKQENEEKSRRIRQSIENNLQGNKERLWKAESGLEKAQEALARNQTNRDNLQSKIYESTHDNWISDAEGWLSEFDDKISDIQSSIDDMESYISKVESWIDEDETKLANWN